MLHEHDVFTVKHVNGRVLRRLLGTFRFFATAHYDLTLANWKADLSGMLHLAGYEYFTTSVAKGLGIMRNLRCLDLSVHRPTFTLASTVRLVSVLRAA
jgi:hypothetical protein